MKISIKCFVIHWKKAFLPNLKFISITICRVSVSNFLAVEFQTSFATKSTQDKETWTLLAWEVHKEKISREIEEWNELCLIWFDSRFKLSRNVNSVFYVHITFTLFNTPGEAQIAFNLTVHNGKKLTAIEEKSKKFYCCSLDRKQKYPDLFVQAVYDGRQDNTNGIGIFGKTTLNQDRQRSPNIKILKRKN